MPFLRSALLLTVLTAWSARADSGSHTAESTETWPQVGGHWGLALSLLNVGTAPAQFIGRDYWQAGLTPGLTLKLDDHRAIDFEFIAFSVWNVGPGGAGINAHTLWVADP